jgi:ribosomal protein L29
MTKDKKNGLLIEMSDDDILKSINEFKKKLLSIRFAKCNGGLVDTSLFKKYKKQIARLNSRLNITSCGGNYA